MEEQVWVDVAVVDEPDDDFAELDVNGVVRGWGWWGTVRARAAGAGAQVEAALAVFGACESLREPAAVTTQDMGAPVALLGAPGEVSLSGFLHAGGAGSAAGGPAAVVVVCGGWRTRCRRATGQCPHRSSRGRVRVMGGGVEDAL